jgi:hypothetical protein
MAYMHSDQHYRTKGLNVCFVSTVLLDVEEALEDPVSDIDGEGSGREAEFISLQAKKARKRRLENKDTQ